MTMPMRFLCLILTASAVAASQSVAQQKRALTARDCVTVRDLQYDESTFRSTIKISPDGSRVAYPVTSPNLNTNNNEVELYVRRFPYDRSNSGHPILVGDISAMRWRPDGRHLTVLIKENGRRMLEEVDSVNGIHHVLVKADADIEEYSISHDGDVVVYSTLVPPAAQADGPTAEEIASGYRIPYQRTPGDYQSKERLFVARLRGREWSLPEPIVVISPLSGQPLAELVYGGSPNINPTLSPDGKTLLVTYWDYSEQMPDEWRQSGFMQLRNSAGVIQAFKLLVLYDLGTGETRVPLKTPFAVYAPLWAEDSKSFVAVALPPIGSELERENVKAHNMGATAASHLFWVDSGTGKIEHVAAKLAYPHEGPLLWDKNGDLFVRVRSFDTIARYSRKSGDWREISSWRLPVQNGSQATTDGNYIIGKFSDTMTPPQLFVHLLGETQIHVFANLNPQFDGLILAQPQEVHWRTSTGFDATGLLLLPPTYVKGSKYPLVIHTKPFGSFFVCGFGNFPAFAPQPIANSGIMYLGQIATKGSTQRDQDYYPRGYPGYQGVGGISEAAFAMDLWDSAVKALDEQGLVDSSRVGIIGFSRTGWYTEFILAHSKLRYRAATVADNVHYSLGEYWLYHDSSTVKERDQTYGGPPYGATLKNWMDFSISFNVDKIHAPLLMEEMGGGTPYNPLTPPLALAASFEVFAGLSGLKRPVELYYYPDEQHTPTHPKARLATMQRNVDWYRFWLKDEEDPDPAKAEQYKRWHELRKVQEAAAEATR